jgi:hypothetical protein
MWFIPASTSRPTVSRVVAGSSYDNQDLHRPRDLGRVAAELGAVRVEDAGALVDMLDSVVRRPWNVPHVGVLGDQP